MQPEASLAATTELPRRSRWAGTATVAAILIAFVVFLFISRRAIWGGAPARVFSAVENTEQNARKPGEIVSPVANSPKASPAAAKPPAPVIDEITVEKEEVCEGEENLISVKP